MLKWNISEGNCTDNVYWNSLVERSVNCDICVVQIPPAMACKKIWKKSWLSRMQL